MKNVKKTYAAPSLLASITILLETDMLEGPSVFRENGIRATGQEVDATYTTSTETEWDYLVD